MRAVFPPGPSLVPQITLDALRCSSIIPHVIEEREFLKHGPDSKRFCQARRAGTGCPLLHLRSAPRRMRRRPATQSSGWAASPVTSCPARAVRPTRRSPRWSAVIATRPTALRRSMACLQARFTATKTSIRSRRTRCRCGLCGAAQFHARRVHDSRGEGRQTCAVREADVDQRGRCRADDCRLQGRQREADDRLPLPL